MIYDLSKKGLETVFYPYQIKAMEHLLKNPGKGYTTAEVHQAVLDALGPRAISRASIINFLSDMADMRFLMYSNEYAKGGVRRRYQAAYKNVDAFRRELAAIFIGHIHRELLEES